MIPIHCTELFGSGWLFLIAPGYLKNAPEDQGHNYGTISELGIKELNPSELIWELWNHGFGKFFDGSSTDGVKNWLLTFSGGKYLVPSEFGGDDQLH